MNDWDRAIGALAAARKVVFFTGAGVSAASGIPTFRDKLTKIFFGRMFSFNKKSSFHKGTHSFLRLNS